MPNSPAPRFRLLGHLDFEGGPDELRGAKQRTLLAYLLLHAGEVLPTDRLVDAVWGEHPPATATAIVHSYVRRIRSALASTTAELHTRAPGYVLDLGGERLDVRVFEQLVRDGKHALDANDPEKARNLITAGLSLWRGDVLADLPPEGFVAEERSRLDELRVQAVLDRVDAELALGGGEALVPELETILRERPFQERPRRQLMLALYRAGRHADALALYRETRRLFAEELGLEPGRGLRELEQAMLRHDESLTPASTPSVPSSVVALASRRKWPLAIVVAAVLAAAVAIPLSTGAGSSRPLVTRPAKVLATFDVAQPSCCGFGFDAVWAAGHHDDTLRRIDPRTNRIVAQLRVVDFQSGVPRPAAGAVWIPAAGGKLIRFDPAVGKVVAQIPVSGPSAAFGFLNMWETTTEHRLVRIDIATNKVAASVRLGSGFNNWVDELAIGEGAVWVAVADQATLDRIDPRTNKIVARIAGFGHTDSGMPIAVDENAVWVLRFVGGTETLFRVDPKKNAIVTRIPVGLPNGAPPSGTVTTGDGDVWTGNWDRTISKVDERTNRVVAVLKVPDVPQNLSFGDGSLWVDSYDASKVWRLDPNS